MKKYLMMSGLLLASNLEGFASYNNIVEDPTTFTLGFIGLIIGFALFLLIVNIVLYVVVAKMAQERKRSVILWVILSLFISPIIPIIILYFVGESDENSEKLID